MMDEISDLGEAILDRLDRAVLQQRLTPEAKRELRALLESFHRKLEDADLAPEERALFENMYCESRAILRDLAVTPAVSAAVGSIHDREIVAQAGRTKNAPIPAEEGFATGDLLADLENVFLTKMQFALEDHRIDADEFDDIQSTLAHIHETLDDIETFSPEERAVVERMCRSGIGMLKDAGHTRAGKENTGADRSRARVRSAALINNLEELRELEEKICRKLSTVYNRTAFTQQRRQELQRLISEMLTLVYADEIVTPEERALMARVFEQTIATYKNALRAYHDRDGAE